MFKEEFIAPQGPLTAKFQIGKSWATALTGFLAGLVFGLIAAGLLVWLKFYR